jgi:hypothetical protein
VRDAAEKLKVKLSDADSASIELVDVAFGTGGKSLRFEFTMERAELGPLADPLIDQTFKVCKRALDNAKVGVESVDQVLLVGGSTLIGRVRERVAEFFQRQPAGGVSPFEAVAIGAAIQAAAMTGATTEDDELPTLDALVMLRSIQSIPPPPPALHFSEAPPGSVVASPLEIPRTDSGVARVARTDPPSRPLIAQPAPKPATPPKGPMVSAKTVQVAGWLLAGALGAALLGILWLLAR